MARKAKPTVLRFLLLALGQLATACGDGEAKITDTAGEIALDGALDATAEIADDVTATDVLDLDKYTGKCKGGPSVCDDDNPCTLDDCDPLVGCTSAVKACADQDPCTVDSCDTLTGNCSHVAGACDDNNLCTADSCTLSDGCGHAFVGCDDGNACTSDGCTPLTGCDNKPLNCDDGQTCTTDSCDAALGCVNSKAAGGACCENPTDCDDGDACTTHTCTLGLCSTVPVANCCQKASECDDANPCTLDTCNKGTGVCGHVVISGAGCCLTVADCDDKNACTTAACVDNQCAQDTVCCQKASDCQAAPALGLCEDVTCTGGACGAKPGPGDGCCKPGSVVIKVAQAKLSPAQKGQWSVDASGKFDASKAGQALLLYEPKLGAPNAGGGAFATVSLQPASLPSGAQVKLTFQWRSKLSGEQVRLRLKTKLGNWIAWQGGFSPNWQTVTVNLTGLAARPLTRDVTLWFEVQPSPFPQSGSFAMIDPPKLDVTCAALTCTNAAVCNDNFAGTADACSDGLCTYTGSALYCEPGGPPCTDNKACTTDFCGANQCQFLPIPNCCTQTADCDDKNVCTSDACQGGQCKSSKQPAEVCCNSVGDCDDQNLCTQDSCPVIGLGCAHTQTDANCCIATSGCDDKDSCTIDVCKANQCEHKNACCQKDADCKDSDDLCTADTCESGTCKYAPTNAVGCCTPGIFAYDFEAGPVTFFTLGGSSTKVKWQQVSGKQAKSGKSALWYGNPATNNYDDGATNKGSVLSGPVTLPAADSLVLTFQVWMDTEFGPPYDNFEARVQVVGGKTHKVWDKFTDKAPGGGNAFAMQKWYPVKVNLSAFAGKTVILEFAFDTVDAAFNQTQGVYLDDIVLQRGCAAPVCKLAAECDDKLKTTSETCSAGFCAYVP